MSTLSCRDLETKILILNKQIERLKRLAYFDELTGILNRRGFLKSANDLFNEARGSAMTRERRKENAAFNGLAILFLDIDFFKKVNDKYSHEAGDFVLKQTAKLLQKRLRGYDIFGRWGGEEFVIALAAAKTRDALAVAQEIRELTARSCAKYKGKAICLTLSIGVCVFDRKKHKDLRQMIDKADQAMYWVKTHGRNSVKLAK
jgi:diguanylate cyclase (GGDEF)-like protein